MRDQSSPVGAPRSGILSGLSVTRRELRLCRRDSGQHCRSNSTLLMLSRLFFIILMFQVSASASSSMAITCTVTNLAGSGEDLVTAEVVARLTLSYAHQKLILKFLINDRATPWCWATPATQVGASLELVCTSPAVYPAPTIIWTVLDWAQNRLEGEESLSETEGIMRSRLSIVHDNPESLTVSCRAENRAGESEVTRRLNLTCEWEIMQCTGPGRPISWRDDWHPFL